MTIAVSPDSIWSISSSTRRLACSSRDGATSVADMPAEYQHEPELGLACGDDGLNLVRRMLAEAADHLTEKGLLIVEVGNSQIHVESLYPEVDFAWLDFERGGHGVFMLTAELCREHQALFASRV